MKKFIIGFYCFVLTCTLISLVFTPTVGKSSFAPEKVIETNDTLNDSLTYIVKDFNGNIAVFEEKAETPFKETQVPTNTLPKLDQERLLNGITVYSQTELNILLEDLCS